MDAIRFTVDFLPEHGCSPDTAQFVFEDRIRARRLHSGHRGWRRTAYEDGRLRLADRELCGALASSFPRDVESQIVGEGPSEGSGNTNATGLEL